MGSDSSDQGQTLTAPGIGVGLAGLMAVGPTALIASTNSLAAPQPQVPYPPLIRADSSGATCPLAPVHSAVLRVIEVWFNKRKQSNIYKL